MNAHYFSVSKRINKLFLCIVLILISIQNSCGSPNIPSDKQIHGYLRYNRDYNFNDSHRIQDRDGKYVIGEYGFDRYSAPRGAYDGDGGKSLFFKIKNIRKIKADKKYPINGKVFETRVVAWGSPAYYERFKILKGYVIVKKYVQYKILTMMIHIQYGSRKDSLKTLNRLVHFKNSSFWLKYHGKINWQSYDEKSTYPRNEIKIQYLQGFWKGYDVFYPSGKEIHTLLDKKSELSYTLEIKGQRLREGIKNKFKVYQLIKNRILLPNNKKYNRYGIINSITPTRLTITWFNEWEYGGKPFNSIFRILYQKQ